jgi:hypothetical protein
LVEVKKGLPPGLMFQARLARRAYRRTLAGLRNGRWSLQGVPVLFSNSFPKSGTHLLTQVLAGFTQLGPAVVSGLPAIVTYAGDSGAQRPPEAILNDIRRLKPGDIAYGHVHAFPQAVQALTGEGTATFFILRDPRDVVVSHAYYVSKAQSNNVHHKYYQDGLQDFDQRLLTSIRGIPGEDAPFPDIAKRFEPYLAWLETPGVLSLRYEDFLDRHTEALGQIVDHALRQGFPLNCARDQAIQKLDQSIDPQRSPTFRRGISGEWRQVFNPEHKRLFKELAGELLIRLGYESDDGW